VPTAFVTGASGFVGANLARALIDRGFAQGRPDVLNYALASLLAVAVVLAIASGARFYLVSWLGERVVGDLRRDLRSSGSQSRAAQGSASSPTRLGLIHTPRISDLVQMSKSSLPSAHRPSSGPSILRGCRSREA